MVGSSFFTQSTNLCLLFGVFGPITFSVITKMVEFKSTIFFLDIFYLSHVFFVSFSCF